MNRQVLVLHYYGDKTISDEIVVKLGKIISTELDDNFRIALFNEQDIAKMLISKVVNSKSATVSIVSSELKSAVDFIQGLVGEPKNTSNKTGENAYVEKLYRMFVELLAPHSNHGDTRRMYRNSLEIVLKHEKSSKAATAYLRDRGFTKRILETIAIQYDYLASC